MDAADRYCGIAAEMTRRVDAGWRVEVPEDTDAQTRLIAFLGRRP